LHGDTAQTKTGELHEEESFSSSSSGNTHEYTGEASSGATAFQQNRWFLKNARSKISLPPNYVGEISDSATVEDEGFADVRDAVFAMDLTAVVEGRNETINMSVPISFPPHSSPEWQEDCEGTSLLFSVQTFLDEPKYALYLTQGDPVKLMKIVGSNPRLSVITVY
jgi:hypothetical protein